MAKGRRRVEYFKQAPEEQMDLKGILGEVRKIFESAERMYDKSQSNKPPARVPGHEMSVAEAFAILKLPVDCNEDELKERFRAMAKEFHPDHNKNSGAQEKFIKIMTAYQVIKDAKNLR